MTPRYNVHDSRRGYVQESLYLEEFHSTINVREAREIQALEVGGIWVRRAEDAKWGGSIKVERVK